MDVCVPSGNIHLSTFRPYLSNVALPHCWRLIYQTKSPCGYYSPMPFMHQYTNAPIPWEGHVGQIRCIQLGSNETLRVRAYAVLTHTCMRAHAFAFTSKRKHVSPRRSALLAKKNRSQTHFDRKCALPIKRHGLF